LTDFRKKRKRRSHVTLDDQTPFEELRRVQRKLKNTPLTLEEITTEVKAVREGSARASSH